MLTRNNLVLALLLAGQIALLAFGLIAGAGSEARPVEKIIADFSPDAVERITLEDDRGETVTFARADDGWVLPDADDFPTDGDKLDDILDKILALDTRRLVASNPANFARLEVNDDDFRRKLTLEGQGRNATVYLGGSGGVDTIYARRAGQDEVYLGFGLNSWELSASASSWVNTSYVSLPQADALEITVENAAGSFNFRREGETWLYTDLPAGVDFEDTKFPSILRNATSLTLLEPLGIEAREEYGMDAPQVTVDLRYRVALESDDPEDEDAQSDAETPEAEPEIQYGEASYKIILGAALDDGVVVKSSDSEYFVLARGTVLDAFKDLRHEDFLRTPAPDPESDPAASE